MSIYRAPSALVPWLLSVLPGQREERLAHGVEEFWIARAGKELSRHE